MTADREPPRQPEHGILGRALSAAAADLPFRLTIAVIILLAIGAVVWMLNLSGGAQGGAPQTHATASPVVEHAEKAAEAGAGAATSYVVRAGDTLRSIARQLYGDENAWERIYAANRPLIANPDSLVVGTHLSIPPPR